MKMRPFEIGILAGFACLFVFALIAVQFFDFTGSSDEVLVGPVEIWGTAHRDVMVSVLSQLGRDDREYSQVTYTQIDGRTFDDELVNAIAEGRGPDIIYVSHTRLVDQAPKIAPISYERFSLRDFKDTFIDGTELYTFPDGSKGYPVAVDPLVMYWNRDIFTSNGFAAAPKTWEEIVNQVVPTIVRRDFNRNILLSPIALGEYRNVTNAFEIVSALMLQGGSQIVTLSGNGTAYEVSLNRSVAGIANPAVNAAEFYTSFATVNNPLYSWNRAQPLDKNMFASGDVAIYFGLGSEHESITRLNPNLNFDVAELPQAATAATKRTYGDFYAFSLLKSSDNPSGALVAMERLAFRYAPMLSSTAGYAPAQRGLLAAGASDPVERVRYNSALYARGWYNPERSSAETIFQEMIEGLLSTRTSASQAVEDAMVKLGKVF